MKKKTTLVTIMIASIVFHLSAKNLVGPMPMIRMMSSARKSQMQMLSKILASFESVKIKKIEFTAQSTMITATMVSNSQCLTIALRCMV